jgi:protein-S-isoprenylcysteine O-methyltransferase Ste14
MLVSWWIFLGNILAITGVIIFVMFITEYQIRPEEEELEKIFGEEYLRYKRRVRRWL